MKHAAAVVVSTLTVPALAGLPVSGIAQDNVYGGIVQVGDSDPVSKLNANNGSTGGGGSGSVSSGQVTASYRSFNDLFSLSAPDRIVGEQRVTVATTADNPNVAASSFAEASNWFLVSGPVSFTLTGRAGIETTDAASGFYSGSVIFDFRSSGVGDTTVFALELGTGDDGVTEFNLSGVLEPSTGSGMQQFFLDVSSIAAASGGQQLSPGSASAFIDYELVFSPVPAPGAVATLGLGGLLAFRRRR